MFAATAQVKGVVHILHVDDQILPEDPSGIRVKASDRNVDDIVVKLARVAEVRAVGIGGEGIDTVEIPSRCRGSRRNEDLLSTDASSGGRGTEEVVGELEVSEKEGCVGHVEPGCFTLGDASVDEKGVRERRFAEGREESRRGEIELGVGGNGLVDTATAQLPSDSHVVEAPSKPVAVVDKLGYS